MRQQLLEAQACGTCGFDASAWSLTDLRRTLDALPVWREALDGARPPSARLVGERRADGAAGRRTRGLLPVDEVLGVVHEGLHGLAAAGADLRAAGWLPTTGVGVVGSVHVGGGGVPKPAVAAADVVAGGLVGDRQGERRHHGAPWQAVSLWSAEVLEVLRSEGHVLAPGDAGENLSVAGLPWGSLRSGVRLRAGGALLELSLPAVPCRKLGHLFVDGRFQRISAGHAPAVARWYASVVEPGRVAVGDRVALTA